MNPIDPALEQPIAQTPPVQFTSGMALNPQEILQGIYAKQKDDNTFLLDRARIVDACSALKAAGFEHLTLITCIDWKDKFEMVYHITKYGRKDLVVLRVMLSYKDPKLPSITSVWPGAGWHERENFDLLGIIFTGNNDLRRILLPDDFEGHPLRKEVKYGNTS